MAIVFDFEVQTDFDFTRAFAQRFHLPLTNHTVQIPDELGNGFIQEVRLDDGLGLCIHQYQLAQSLVLNRHPSEFDNQLTIKFDARRVTRQSGTSPHEPLFSASSEHAVELATTNFLTQITLPAGQSIQLLIITIARPTLLSLLHLEQQGQVLEQILRTNRSFVYYLQMTPEMEQILAQLRTINESTVLVTLLYRTKVYELIYRLFEKLLTRPDNPTAPIDQVVAQKVYAVREILLTDLSKPPRLTNLAVDAGLSKTKMTRLFRQIFGDSIQHYHQAARMREAARLLQYLPVSETGYQLGFTNLSHFTRLFERHYHLKPKQYKEATNVT